MGFVQTKSDSAASKSWVVPTAFVVGAFTLEAATLTYDYAENKFPNTERSEQVEEKFEGTSSLKTENYLSQPSGMFAYPDWYDEALGRLKELAEKENGWKGAGSIAPSQSALYFAYDLLHKLALENIDRRPSIGLDYEGTFSLSWVDEVISIDLTVYDDGNYSFFASNQVENYSVDEETLANPLSGQLLSILFS